MTRKVYNVGGGRHSEAALSALLSQLLNGDVARGLNIEPTGSAGLSVRITAGTGQIRVSQFHSRVIQSDAAETTTAVPAPTSNPRRNLVVAYIDPAVTPTTSVVDNTNGVFKFAVIQGAEAATPQIPTNTTVTAALGTENWIPLGDFRTNVGATSVVLANITDQRRMILVTSDKLDFASFRLAYVEKTSSATSTSSTPVQISGLTTGSITIPAGVTNVKVTLYAGQLYSSVANNATKVTLWSGTVGSGTQYVEVRGFHAGASGNGTPVAMAIVPVTPGGSITFNGGIAQEGGGTATAAMSSTNKGFILVEAI